MNDQYHIYINESFNSISIKINKYRKNNKIFFILLKIKKYEMIFNEWFSNSMAMANKLKTNRKK